MRVWETNRVLESVCVKRIGSIRECEKEECNWMSIRKTVREKESGRKREQTCLNWILRLNKHIPQTCGIKNYCLNNTLYSKAFSQLKIKFSLKYEKLKNKQKQQPLKKIFCKS